MSELIYEKSTIYTATTDIYVFTIHQKDRKFQVMIKRCDASILVDFPPKFGSLPAAKHYIDAWRIMHEKKTSSPTTSGDD